MNLVGAQLKRLAENDLLQMQEANFALGPEYQPALNANRLEYEPLSFIVGEHPSEYSVSPLMWNAEFKLREAKGVFIPVDIPQERHSDLTALLDIAFSAGAEHFRVLTVTNPYKIQALEYFRAQALKHPSRVVISEDAKRIGATNQILVGPDSVFHVINSDGQGMVNAISTHLAEMKAGELKHKHIGVIGAGGAARGIVYELAKRVVQGRGSISLFNRTESKAASLALELLEFFPGLIITAHPLDALPLLAREEDLLVSSITTGDPLAEHAVYQTLAPRTLIMDANYGENSVLEKHAAEADRTDLSVRDGSGMVVEGYVIPSRTLAGLWKYAVPTSVYKTIGKLFGYSPRRS